MTFKMVILPPWFQEGWPEKIRNAVPTAIVNLFHDPKDAAKDIEDADCAYGDVIPELFARARKLRWIQCYAAGPAPSFYHDVLVKSDVVVTNFRGIYNDVVGAHAMALVLALARRFHHYMRQQFRGEWKALQPSIHLSDTTALVIGVGGIGSETARLCHAFGMNVIAIDPRVKEQPPYVKELHPPEALEGLLPRADFVIITTPETPQTRGMINSACFNLMKPSAFLINVGRGVCVVLNDLVQALRSGRIAGAGLDVFETEPLPSGHPLWGLPNVIITPHVAGPLAAPHVEERRTRLFIENCRRFDLGEPLVNVVDKANWF